MLLLSFINLTYNCFLSIFQGQVKIVRHQIVIDARASNESKFTAPRIEELGCGRSFSHAEGITE